MKYKCKTCDRVESSPLIDGVNAHFEYDNYWCVHCAPIKFVDGNAMLTGKNTVGLFEPIKGTEDP